MTDLTSEIPDPLTPAQLVGAMLSHIRAHRVEYLRARNRADSVIDELAEQLQDILKSEKHRDRFRSETRTRTALVAWLQNVKVGTEIEHARAIVQAVEALFGSDFLYELTEIASPLSSQNSTARVLKQDDILRKPGGYFRKMTKDSLTTDPRRLPSNRLGDSSEYLMLAPDSANGFNVEIDYSLFNGITAIGDLPVLQIAACLPTVDFGTYSTEKSSTDQFFGVYPSNGIGQVSSLVKQAVDEGANIIVLPELTIHNSSVDQLVGVFADAVNRRAENSDEDNPALLLLGSYHIMIGGECQNISELAYVSGAGEPPKKAEAHRKIIPYVDRRANPERQESIREPIIPTIKIFEGSNLRVGAVICIDFLDHGIRDLLRDLKLDVLLLPTMSFTSGIFEDLVAAYVVTTQAVAVMPNAFISETSSLGVFGHPLRTSRLTSFNDAFVDQYSDSNLGIGPGVAMLQVGAGKVIRTWLPECIGSE